MRGVGKLPDSLRPKILMSPNKSSRFHSKETASFLFSSLFFNPLSSFLAGLLISFSTLAALPLKPF